MKSTPLFALISFGLAGLVRAAAPTPAEVVHFDHTKTDEAFAKGLVLQQTDSYRISTSRRVTPGVVEIHEKDTDIFYVLEGDATFVTGGTAVDAKPSGPDEQRAPEIKGGVSRHLGKGDIIVIPRGVPHWFKEVKGTFVYLVVKVAK